MTKIVVRHPCGHYELHIITAKNDAEVAQIEAQLMKQPCTNCKKGN
jgi:hypothetical protein